MPSSLVELEQRIGYRFKDPALLETALRHSSYVNESSADDLESNECLEFLGDAVVSICVTTLIFEKNPGRREGELTALRASLVCTSSLAEKADKLGLGDFLLLGRGAEKQGERENRALLENTFEAVTGAVFRDGGFAEAMAFVARMFEGDIEEYTATGSLGTFDCKSELQILLQRDGEADIRYKTVGEEGPDHDKTFKVRVFADGETLGEGRGKTKKLAEQEAAKAALKKIGGK